MSPGRSPTAEEVKRANLAVYNRKTVASYGGNRSIFNPRRQEAVERVLEDLAARTRGGAFLDLGCGSGNLLRLARPHFAVAVGVDLAWRLLADLRASFEGLHLAAGDTERLPFPSNRFGVVALNAVLHHLLDPSPTFAEAFRCLEPGGYLYTDHDPNWFFHRFYHVWYRLRHARAPGFGSADEEIAEYHQTQGAGLDPRGLELRLRSVGFREVTVGYRHTDSPSLSLPARLAAGALRCASRVMPLRSFYTHFWMLARK